MPYQPIMEGKDGSESAVVLLTIARAGDKDALFHPTSKRIPILPVCLTLCSVLTHGSMGYCGSLCMARDGEVDKLWHGLQQEIIAMILPVVLKDGTRMTRHGPKNIPRFGKSWHTKKYFNPKFPSPSLSRYTNTMASSGEGRPIRLRYSGSGRRLT